MRGHALMGTQGRGSGINKICTEPRVMGSRLGVGECLGELVGRAQCQDVR